MKDPALALFEGLKDYPGNTPPKNRPAKKKNPATPLDETRTWDSSPRWFKVKGVEREFFTIGALAEALGRKPVTIRDWEANGVIPKSNFRTPAPRGAQAQGSKKGRRLYTRAQVELLIAAAAEFGITGPRPKLGDFEKFKQHVRRNWPTQ